MTRKWGLPLDWSPRRHNSRPIVSTSRLRSSLYYPSSDGVREGGRDGGGGGGSGRGGGGGRG